LRVAKTSLNTITLATANFLKLFDDLGNFGFSNVIHAIIITGA
jgi:hypothetical protein